MILQWPPTKEVLFDLYVTQKLDCTIISKMYGHHSKTIWKYLKNHGIQTRPRGALSGHGFVKGQASAFKGRKHTEENKEKVRQARLMDGRVPYMKGGKHWLHHEGAQSPAWNGGTTPERQKAHSSLLWKECVKAVWKRDNAICQRCGLDHRTIDRKKIRFHIHHKVSFQKKAWRFDVENLVLLCGPCHRWVHGKENINKEFITILKKVEIPEWIKPRYMTK